MKVALYESRNTVSRTSYVFEATEWMEEDNTNYVRVSNIVEVDFVPIPDDIIIPQKIECIRAEKAKKMAEFDDKISKLLAITYNPEDIVPVEDQHELERELEEGDDS